MDNFFKQCPPKLDDGRFIGEFRNDTRINEYIKSINGLNRDDDYRMFLQENASKILNNEWKYLKDNNSCWTNNYVHNYPSRMDPKLFGEEMLKYNLRYSKKYPKPTYEDFRMSK